jgi:hypothetical protein
MSTNAYLNLAKGYPEPVNGLGGAAYSLVFAWSPSLLMPILLTLDASGNLKTTATGGGGGGGASTIADGADTAEGTTTDVAIVTDIAGTVSGKLRGVVKIFASVWDSANGRMKVDGSTVTQPVSIAASVPVTGTFYQTTQPVSGSISFTAPQHVIVDTAPTTAVTIATMPSTPVTGTFWQSTQPVSLTALPVGHNIVDSGSITVANASLAVTGSFWQSTQPVSIASLPALTAGSAMIGHVVVDTAPVTHVIADSGTITSITNSVSVTGTFWQSTQPVSVTALPLPSSAATDARQDTGNTSLAAIVAALAALPVFGVVSDTPPNPLDGMTTPLSLTKQGRLRVATTPEEVSIPLVSETEEMMWGAIHVNDTCFSGSPWASW